MKSIREQAADTEQNAELGPGNDERFSGYGVMGLPFSSGHVLAMRRFPVTSVGPCYTSVWLRRPSGRPSGAWSIYADAPPEQTCARYFGSALESAVQCPVTVASTGNSSFSVTIGRELELAWHADLAFTHITRAMTLVMSALPTPLLESTGFLKSMSLAAGPMLGAGRLGLAGDVPNGQGVRAKPRQMWFISGSTATVGGEDLGTMRPLTRQTRLGDFWIPQRGIFVIGASSFDTYDAGRHLPASTRRAA